MLKRLKLIDHLTTEIQINKEDFVARFSANVASGAAVNFFFNFEAFSFNGKEYSGTVASNSFKIRKRRKFFDMNPGLATAEGNFRQNGESLIIESKIKGFHPFIAFFMSLALIAYFVVTASVISGDLNEGMGLAFFPFLLIHATFMFGIPYLMMRRSVSKLKYDLERDLFFLTKGKP